MIRSLDDNEDYLNPEWDKAKKVHDWRNHVGEKTKGIWHTFTPEQKFCIALDAETQAGYEEWD